MLALTKTIYQLGFRCGQTSAQPAIAAVRLDRNEARNPQLYIVPSVINHIKSLKNTQKSVHSFIALTLFSEETTIFRL
jgi:hypothetical protein